LAARGKEEEGELTIAVQCTETVIIAKSVFALFP